MVSSAKFASRLAAAGACALVAGASVAGCSSSSSSPADASPVRSHTATAASSAPAASPTSAPASAAPSSSPNAASAPASGSPTSGAGSAGAPQCGSMDLSAHVGLAQGTAGSIYQVIYLTNLGNTACSLYGYPGVALAGGSSQVDQVGAAASRSSTTAAAVVTLGPGDSANATLRIVEAGNYPTTTCKPTATTFLQIFPPGQTTPIYLAYKSTGCSATSVNLLSVTVMTPGTGG
jgi:hypothetical protein